MSFPPLLFDKMPIRHQKTEHHTRSSIMPQKVPRTPLSHGSCMAAALVGALSAAHGISTTVRANPWPVPAAGNAYLTTTSGREPGDGPGQHGPMRWQDKGSVFSVFFRVDRAAALDLTLRMKVLEGESVIEVRVGGTRFEIRASGMEQHDVALGKVYAGEAGYVRVDLRGLSRTGPDFAEISDLVVATATEGVKLDFVRNNDGNMFYWGRRGPSVHLAYQMPQGRDIEYTYSELTVPDGGDPVGSYYMANGFGEGYFGIQTKSPTERWVLFSVWSPYKTDNPEDIPEAQRVILLTKGEGVKTGVFGNEGSGGQSYRIYPWKTGTTYRFLNAVKPDGSGNSIYTAWIAEAPSGKWDLMAKFKRPQTNKHLTGFHSFLENFVDSNGWLGRRSLHGNQWVRDTSGVWHEITAARLTGDNTARMRYRLDYAGGLKTNGFFLKNGGFFQETVELDQTFMRPSNPAGKPEIDFAKLEGR